jgi:hypothetical protein
MSYYLRLPLVLDIMKICIDFGPYDAFLSSDVPKNGRSIKLVELVSNRLLSSTSCMKCRYVGSKYMHFMTANTPPHLEFCSSLSKRKELNPGDVRNSSAAIARE